ncbi:MAG: sigma-70 family RNA polymerase sigma factor [Bacteroidetes bacterium]|nr:sigma-70 family RNA polymerase sigma factor [Bacteroidota bacterium]
MESTYDLSIEELNLLEGCLKHDRLMQKRLYYKYCDAMFTLAYRILNDNDEANDALQDAFLQVFQKMDQFKRQSTLGSWIKTIVIRTAIKHLKNLQLFDSFQEQKHDSITLNNTEIDGKILEKVILSLPDGYRTIFILAEVEGYKHREIAEMLNISEGTSKSQLFNAKKMLKVILKNDWL